MNVSYDDSELMHLAELVGRCLLAGKQTLSVAESCTGGWISKALTDVPGSSQWFSAGLTTYSNAAKKGLLGVSDAAITVYGAVSTAVVSEMTRGALSICDSDWSLAVSGIAGPGGGTEEKPVGTVCFAWGGLITEIESEQVQFPGDREQVRRASVAHALKGLILRVNQANC